MTAAKVLQTLGSIYAAAAAYRDVGRAVFSHQWRGVEQRTIGEFRTAFLRSKGFRFEYREVSGPRSLRDTSARKRFCIRVERGRVVDIQGIECSRQSVSLAVASMMGITFGAAHYVLRMLLPDEIEGRTLAEAPSAKLLRESAIDGKAFFAIRLGGQFDHEILVDENFALWRVGSIARPSMGLERPQVSRVLTYEPELFAEEPPNMNMDW
jgi:hypothetical protein